MEILLPLLSGAFWTVAYVNIIRASLNDQTFGIPVLAAALNLTWEALYFSGGLVYWHRYQIDTHIQTGINGVWLVLDVIIVVLVYRFMKKEVSLGSIPRIYLLVGALGCAALFQVSMLLSLDPQDAARLSAFIQNLFMSGAFIMMLLARGPRGQRQSIAIAKMLGTLVATLSAGFVGGFVPSIALLGAACAVLDVCYFKLLSTKIKAHQHA